MIVKYDNATKATWRGWAWNQLAHRIPKGSLVMVLCGNAALDVEHAKRRKFKVVGVDKDSSCVAFFRQSGGVAICDDIFSQILLMKPDAVILDELSGIYSQTFDHLFAAQSHTRAMVINLLRGRDPMAVSLRGELGVNDKHRGKVIYRAYCEILRKEIQQHFVKTDFAKPEYRTLSSRIKAIKNINNGIETLFKQFEKNHQPTYYSYKSKDSGQIFDSVALTCENSMDISDTRETGLSKRKSYAAKAVLTKKYG